MQKIIMPTEETKNFLDVFELFVISQSAKGVADVTIRNYRCDQTISQPQRSQDSIRPQVQTHLAKKYLMDCGGNAFALQKLMGHSTLNMTKHYCRLFDNDVGKDYDLYFPLAQMLKTKSRISK